MVFVNRTFETISLKGAKLVRKAEELYPAGYNLDLLFVQDWQEYKLNRDLNRGSKKPGKIEKQINKRLQQRL